VFGLRGDPQGSVKQIHHEELEDGNKERSSVLKHLSDKNPPRLPTRNYLIYLLILKR
jgi:hypothetical protein